MKKIFIFIKKYWLIGLVVVAVILYVVNLFIKGNTNFNPSPSATPGAATYKSLIPGVSTSNQVSTVLGIPIDTKTTSNQTVSEYSSTNKNRFHEVTFTNGVTALIKEVVNSNDNVESTYITDIYGVAPYILYNKIDNNPFNLYIYPQYGISYLGGGDDTVLEIWYFQPTTIDDFTKNWGTGFSETQSINNTY